ncbi:MAG TPA: porin [Candidatus Baltobacteraceae bacterium]|nr:porin [Candidatus Baltobacteraceae bacterium]
MAKKLLAFTVAALLSVGGVANADDTSDTQAKIQALQAQLDAIKAQLTQLQQAQAQAAQHPGGPPPAPGPNRSFIEMEKGNNVVVRFGDQPIQFYGNLDLSLDDATKGLADSYPQGGTPYGNHSWQGDISTNLSYIGARGARRLSSTDSLVFQLETQIDVSASSGITETQSNTSDVVKGGLTSRNSYIGLANKYVGSIKVGKTDAPYKTSTARMNPFSGEWGDYSVIMGNTGGDNRTEFGTRLDHSVWWESPKWGGFAAAVLVSPGMDRAPDSSLVPEGEPDCAGGNIPGSGALQPFCNDGSFSDAYSASVSEQLKNLYVTAAYEMHKKVNRVSDLGAPTPAQVAADVADEDAAKVGAQYVFGHGGPQVSAIYESMHRYVPQFLEFQNERTRDGFWLAYTQPLDPKSNVNFGWARANPTPGDPGQHNTPGGANPDNMANMYTVAYKHQIDRHVGWYVDWAETLNHTAAHYDLGAGGRGITTDCHDATTLQAFDPTTGTTYATGPHCFAGGHLMGVSLGLDVRF